jgi:lipopolysaccharide biosynthesis glycosyltransferase
MKEPVHVLASANRNYFIPLTVMLASVAANFDPNRKLVLHIVRNDATEKDKEDLRQSILLNRPKLELTDIHWYTFDASRLEGLPLFSYFSPEVYASLIGLTLLPDTCRKVIGLDCDVIVDTDLSKLHDLSTGMTTIHAAQDVASPWVSSPMGVFDYKERGMSPSAKLFNSGVVVYNLDRWRKRNLTPRILEYMAVNSKKVKAQDQAGMNALLYQDWTELDPRWNQGFDIMFFEKWKGAGYSHEDWLRVRDNPYILHFSGAKKPWQKGRRGPRYSYFYKYLAKTVFKDNFPGHPVLESIIGFRAYFQVWRIARFIPGLIKR